MDLISRAFFFIKQNVERIITVCVMVLLVCFAVYSSFIMPPQTPVYPVMFTVPEGAILTDVVDKLQSEHLIRSSEFTKDIIISFYHQHIIAGEYSFQGPQTSFTVARRIATGDYGFQLKLVTIPEGARVDQIVQILSDKLGPSFDTKAFIAQATPKEGYLFPDTYFLFPNTTPQMVINVMTKNFNKKIATLQTDINNSGHSLSDVVIMASILEKEALTYKDKQIVAGILWKRIKLGMPLQVDAAFQKIPQTQNKTSGELTVADLKIDSPYNTYLHKGLPPTPISNPGLASLRAAVNPQPTEYLYYLSDKSGIIHYAINFEQHKENITKFL